MVAAFFLMELNLNGLACDLIKGHIERALPRDEYALSAIVLLLYFGDFKHEWYLPGELMIVHEYR